MSDMNGKKNSSQNMVRYEKMARRLTLNIFAFVFLTQLLTTQARSAQDDAREKPNASQQIRRIDFRDGSSIEAVFPNAEIKWSNISKDGEITERSVSISKVRSILLVAEPSTSRVSKIRNLLSQLGSDNYHQRIGAQVKLARTGKEFEQIIKQYQPEDEETRWRIEKVKSILANADGPESGASTFDIMQVEGDAKNWDGELQPLSFEALYGDVKIKIDRKNVAAISTNPIKNDYVLENSIGGGNREQEYPDANGEMPLGMEFENFEKLPDGQSNRANIDVSSLFSGKGILFESSFKDSYVGIQAYAFSDGKGGEYSIANVEPTYEGEITIKFCVPGNPLFAAGTKYVGFNVSHVNANGTLFEAFTAQGKLITRFATDDTGTDYLGFRSEVPIAKVVVRPNPEADDPDYAIDDLFFETPVALLEAGHPSFFSIVTKKGERLQAKQIGINKTSVVLKDVSFGAKEINIPIDDVWVAIPPRSAQKTFANPKSETIVYGLLSDGTIALLDVKTKTLARLGGVRINDAELVAIWGLNNQLAIAPEEELPMGAYKVYANDRFFDLANAKFGDKWIESPSIEELWNKEAEEKGNGADLVDSTYKNSPCVYFQVPAPIIGDFGVLYTFDGERYFIGEKAGYAVELGQAGIKLTGKSKTIELKWDQVQSLRFPQK